MKIKHVAPEVLSFVLVLGFMLFYYSPMLLNPNAWLTVGDGDGIKAFYVYAGHIRNSLGYNQFEGMNYPYGQTHIFTDGQTILAMLFKFLAQYFPFFNTHSMGIYNVLMLMSYPLCAMVLAGIIKRLGIPLVITVVASFSITILSPQYFRLFGHPTLSYVVAVPLMWWLFIRYKESSKKLKWSVLIACNAMFWFMVHPYYIMLWVMFAMAYFFVEWLQQKEKKAFVKREWLYLVLQTVVPLVITRLYVKAVELHTTRSESPYGFWEYYAEWNSVFVPNHGIHASFFKQLLFPNGTQNWEGQAYIGLGAVLVVIYSQFKIIRYVVKRKWRLVGCPVLPAVLKTSVWASVLVLLFSMCLPFQLGLHSLVEHLSFLKQFRSLGRFAWVFYYVMSVYAVYVLYLVYRKLRIKNLTWVAYAVVTAYFVVHIAEAIPYHNEGKPKLHESPNYFNKKYLPRYYKELITEISKVKDDYQCLIMFPFYHIGSENFGKDFSPQSIQNSMVASYWTNVPLLNSSAARSPILEAKYIMQFFSPPFFKKEIEQSLSSKKDFLLLYNNEPLTDVELYWYNRAACLWKNERFELRRLRYETVFDYNANLEKEFLAGGFLQSINSIERRGAESLRIIVQNNFNTLKSEHVFFGAGALQGNKKDFTVILKRGNYNLDASKEYVVGFWYYNKDELRTQSTCIIEQCDAQGNQCNWDVIWNPGESMVVAGDWSYVTKKFKPQTTGGQISVFVSGDKHSSQQIFMDEFALAEILNTPNEKQVCNILLSDAEIKTYYQHVASIIESIKADSKWLKDIEAKAAKQNIPLDSMLRLDAMWMIEQENK